EGIELSGNFVASVDAKLTVGSIQETITVSAESPVVDVQSTRSQQVIGREVLSSMASSRNVNGIQALIPGANMQGDQGGLTGSMQGGATYIHGGRAKDYANH